MKVHSAQIDLFPLNLHDHDAINRLLAALPPLPPVIRYFDDFDEKPCSIRAPSQLTEFQLAIRGLVIKIDFSRFESNHALLLKQVFLFLLGEDLSVSTATLYIQSATHLSAEDVASLIGATPHGIVQLWAKLRGRDMPVQSYSLAKALLRLMCRHRLHDWSDEYETFIRFNLPLPSVDGYLGVRSGDAFLSTDEEAAIVRHLDEVVDMLKSSGVSPPRNETIADAGMLLCAYQFAMRPIQIAKLTLRNMRSWSELGDDELSVHLTFHMAKQRSDAARHPLTRRVKREWVPIFIALRERHLSTDLDGAARLFPVKSGQEVGSRVARLVRELIGADLLGTATDLRHTAAQRLVDAGASHEELAEFMGHSHTQTGLVYYQTSATHAERVNRALGASDVYRRVAKIAHDRFITAEELAHLKGEQQVAGVPHGIPIAGIGGCSSGQPTCPYNPVTACYGCRKFMPLRDKAIHEQVLADMRSVVLFFSESSRGDTRSPAYLQLQRTIAEIQTVLTELDADQS